MSNLTVSVNTSLVDTANQNTHQALLDHSVVLSSESLEDVAGPFYATGEIFSSSDPSILSRQEQYAAAEAAIFYEITKVFGLDVAHDVISGYSLSPDTNVSQINNIVMEHVHPSSIDLSTTLESTFGSLEREAAATQLLKSSQLKGEWTEASLSFENMCYLDGTSNQPGMPIGNCFITRVGLHTALPDYRLIIRAWKQHPNMSI